MKEWQEFKAKVREYYDTAKVLWAVAWVFIKGAWFSLKERPENE